MARRLLASALTVVSLVFSAALAHAGGGLVNSVQDGDWNDSSTWDVHVPDGGAGDQARIAHAVDVTSPGTANVLEVGWSGGVGTLNAASGSLDVSAYFIVGWEGVPGTANLAGSAVTAGIVRLGEGGPGEMTISGGSLTSPNSIVGDGSTGRLTVDGSGGSIFAGSFLLASGGTVAIRPSANGAPGLSTIQCNGITLNAGCSLELDIASYVPVVGDAWDVLDGGAVSGSFTNLNVPPGFALSETHPNGTTVRITVTASPASPGVPGASPYGMALAVVLLLGGGGFVILRRHVLA